MPDKRAFQQFYASHINKVYRFILFRCGGNKDTAEDLVSEIFMKALEHFDSYNEKVSKSAWIMTIAKNHLLNYWRDTKKTIGLPEDEAQDDDEKNSDAFWLKASLEVWKKNKVHQEVVDYLAELSKEEIEIVTFHYIMGYNYAEIAEMKNMTEGAVKVAAHRAVKKMRNQ